MTLCSPHLSSQAGDLKVRQAQYALLADLEDAESQGSVGGEVLAGDAQEAGSQPLIATALQEAGNQIGQRLTRPDRVCAHHCDTMPSLERQESRPVLVEHVAAGVAQREVRERVVPVAPDNFRGTSAIRR